MVNKKQKQLTEEQKRELELLKEINRMNDKTLKDLDEMIKFNKRGLWQGMFR